MSLNLGSSLIDRPIGLLMPHLAHASASILLSSQIDANDEDEYLGVLDSG